MKVIYAPTGEAARVVECDGSLESMQKMVGGYIEAIYPFPDPVALVCDEEGWFNYPDVNRVVCGHPIKGAFFLCGIGREDFESIPDGLVDKYIGMLN